MGPEQQHWFLILIQALERDSCCFPTAGFHWRRGTRLKNKWGKTTAPGKSSIVHIYDEFFTLFYPHIPRVANIWHAIRKRCLALVLYYSACFLVVDVKGLLEEVEEDEVDGLPSNFSDSECGSNMDSDNDALPKNFQANTVQINAACRSKLERNDEAYALCHMDSYCKLVSYGFYVHAIICGATHYIVTWELSTSKESHAIFNTYAQAVRRFGRPKHIRSDNALEHNEEFSMYLIHGTTRVYVVSLLCTSRRIFHTGLQLGTSMRIMPAVGGKDIEDLSGPFLSNVEGATLLEALGTVQNQAFFMHREGLNLDEQYLLHLDLTKKCAMADAAGVDLPLYIESALPTATLARSKNTTRLNSSTHYAGNTSRVRSQALNVPQSVQPTVPRDTRQPLDFPSSAPETSTPTASHPQLLTAFEQAECRLTLHTLQHMRNLQHVSFSSPSLESSSSSIRNEQVRTPHAYGVVQSGMLPPTPTTGRAHGTPYSATATSPTTPPTATTLATPSTGTSANTWPSTSRSNKRSSLPGIAQHAILLSLQASGIQPSSMTNPGAFVWRARQSNGGEAHAESTKFGLSSIQPCYWPPQTSWGAIANKANGNRATLSYPKQARALEEKDVRKLVAATNTLTANDDPRPATQEPNPYENNEEEDSADEEDILPLPEETLPTQDNIDISEVEEQDKPMVVYDSDGGGLEDHGVPPPLFLEGSSSTPFTLMELLNNFSTVELLERQQRWIDATNALNEAVQLTTQDNANFIMLQHEEVSALQDATTTLEVKAQGDAEVLLQVQWLKHKLLGCFGVESTSDEEMLDVIARHPEFHWAGGEIFLRRVLFNQAMPHWQDWESVLLKLGLSEAQYEDVFCDNTIQQLLTEVNINVPSSILEFTIAWFIEKSHALAIQTCSYMFEAVSHSGGPYAKAIREAVHQIPGLTRGLFVLKEGATYWHPRMPVYSRTLRQEERDVVSHGCTIATLAIAAGEVPNEDDRRLARGGLYEMDFKACAPHIWNALNQLRGASNLKEKGDRRKSVDSILENPAITDYNAVEACVAMVVWCYLFIKPNVVGNLLRDGFQHSMRMEAHQRPYKSPALLGGLSLIGTDALLQVFRVRTIIPPVEFINYLIFDQDFGEKFRSWIVDIIRDMSPKELSKFHHFAVDSPEFQPREPIWIQIKRQNSFQFIGKVKALGTLLAYACLTKDNHYSFPKQLPI
ncbi:hypothetical protein SELMODRAFT_414985 [Selaginella moellendorffii]|uniref:Integrase core domain-containing protein n=1 Tax=Selaginella moellendorffii TaxID=88036 RepID=D8RU81_SELML|nr:hypothetical protein SELMODRAFT_414985 [Selaginella moellendorffii]